VRDLLFSRLEDLRYEPTGKRIRARLGDRTVVDSRRALLVWEPKRIVPSYAVPVDDVDADVVSAPASAGEPPAFAVPQLGDRPVFDPSVPFAVHTAPGEPALVRLSDGGPDAAAFLPSDDALEGYVVLDFAGFDAWFEEDERNLAHPRDPFHRIEILHSSRHVRIERDGEVLAETTSPYLLFEPPLPVRYYLPPEDVRTDLLRPSTRTSFCAYKGQASYFSLAAAPDVAWTYPEPLREAAEVTGRIAFFDELVDVVTDGERQERPVTPWSRG
jgi:uncharacterized protein (DUF427 family)